MRVGIARRCRVFVEIKVEISKPGVKNVVIGLSRCRFTQSWVFLLFTSTSERLVNLLVSLRGLGRTSGGTGLEAGRLGRLSRVELLQRCHRDFMKASTE